MLPTAARRVRPRVLRQSDTPERARPSEGLTGALCGVGRPTFEAERRQCGGFRPFKRSGLNTRFVPQADIA